MPRARDSQKQKLYDAENIVRRQIGDVAITDRVVAWAFIEKVERDKWFIRHYGRRKFRISDGRGTTIARGGGNHLNLPRWSRTPLIMLHEIAHNVAPSGARHNWPYAAVYLQLVKHFLGKEVHERLRAAFKAGHVRYKKPRQLAPDVRARLAARMMEVRLLGLAAKAQS